MGPEGTGKLPIMADVVPTSGKAEQETKLAQALQQGQKIVARAQAEVATGSNTAGTTGSKEASLQPAMDPGRAAPVGVPQNGAAPAPARSTAPASAQASAPQHEAAGRMEIPAGMEMVREQSGNTPRQILNNNVSVAQDSDTGNPTSPQDKLAEQAPAAATATPEQDPDQTGTTPAAAGSSGQEAENQSRQTSAEAALKQAKVNQASSAPAAETGPAEAATGHSTHPGTARFTLAEGGLGAHSHSPRDRPSGAGPGFAGTE
jgi:hypothetical protein